MAVGLKKRDVPKRGETWKHFKGSLYKIEAVAQHTETGDMFVIYCGRSNAGVNAVKYCRPLEMFMSRVDTEKYPKTEQEYRFEKVLDSPVMPDVELEIDNFVESPSTTRHMHICKELNRLYAKKNHDYGDSFHQSYLEEGLAMARVRLTDKLLRFKTLSRTQAKIKDESIRDTLMDLANYSIMTVMELDQEAEG